MSASNAKRSPTHFDHLPHLHRQVRGAGPIRACDLPDADVIVATWWETAEWVSVLPPSKGARVHLIQHDERIFSAEPAKRARAAATWKLPGFTRVVVAGWLGDLGRREFGVESTLTPGSGGVFDVFKDGDLIFSKHKTGRFPEHAEIVASLNGHSN